MRVPKPFKGRSLTTQAFWDCFARLASDDKNQAREAHRLCLGNPRLPGLRFKKVHSRRPVYSVRVNLDVRAVGIMDADDMVWFWFGPHDDYEALLKRL